MKRLCWKLALTSIPLPRTRSRDPNSCRQGWGIGDHSPILGHHQLPQTRGSVSQKGGTGVDTMGYQQCLPHSTIALSFIFIFHLQCADLRKQTKCHRYMSPPAPPSLLHKCFTNYWQEGEISVNQARYTSPPGRAWPGCEPSPHRVLEAQR